MNAKAESRQKTLMVSTKFTYQRLAHLSYKWTAERQVKHISSSTPGTVSCSAVLKLLPQKTFYGYFLLNNTLTEFSVNYTNQRRTSSHVRKNCDHEVTEITTNRSNVAGSRSGYNGLMKNRTGQKKDIL